MQKLLTCCLVQVHLLSQKYLTIFLQKGRYQPVAESRFYFRGGKIKKQY